MVGRESGKLVFDLDESPGAPPVSSQLRDALTSNAIRVIDLFRDMDDDGSGCVEKKEFRKAMKQMGFDVQPEAIDFVFDAFDRDGSGVVTFAELNKQLRRGSTIELPAHLRVRPASPEPAVEVAAAPASPTQRKRSLALKRRALMEEANRRAIAHMRGDYQPHQAMAADAKARRQESELRKVNTVRTFHKDFKRSTEARVSQAAK